MKMQSLYFMKQILDNPETSAAGSKWTDDEEKALLKSIGENKPIEDIAKDHKRTSGGIKSRLRVIAVRMIETEERTIEDVCKVLRMTPEEVLDAQKRRKSPTKKEPTEQSNSKPETMLDVLKDIREILLRVENKLM